MVEDRAIVYYPEYCSGCMYCMTACSTYNGGATSLYKSLIYVIRHEGHAVTGADEEDELIFQMVTCQQCDEPYCQYVCPTLAIERDAVTGIVNIDHDKCVVCRMCVVSCPFGAIRYDRDIRQVLKCEQCGSEPQCVKFCPTGALQYLPKDSLHIRQRDRLGKKMVELHRKVTRELPSREMKDADS